MAPRLDSLLERIPDRLCELLAVAGGLVLVALVIMTVLSIAGRFLFAAPVPGDFELMEIGCTVAVFAFLPYCQVTGSNIAVDFFARHLPPRLTKALEAVGNLGLGLLALLLAWRMALGGWDMRASGEVTMVLGMPRWWGFVPIVPSTLLLAVVGLQTAWRSAIHAVRP